MKTGRIQLMSTLALLCSCLTLLFAFDATYRIDTPAGGDDPSEGDDRIREAKLATQERLDVDHWFNGSAPNVFDDPNTGKHRQVTFVDPNDGDAPTPGYREGILYTADVNDSLDYFDLELLWVDDDGNTLQLTDQGKLNIDSNDLVDKLSNDTWFTAADANGEGEYINLIKAGRNEDDDDDVAILPVGTRLEADTDPNEDCDLVPKSYVDDILSYTHMFIKYQVYNEHGGDLPTKTYTIRPINDIDDPHDWCTLADNKLTFIPGTYRCRIEASYCGPGSSHLALFDMNPDEYLIFGVTTRSNSVATLSGEFTIPDDESDHPLVIYHYSNDADAGAGMGMKVADHYNTYLTGEFWKID